MPELPRSHTADDTPQCNPLGLSLSALEDLVEHERGVLSRIAGLITSRGDGLTETAFEHATTRLLEELSCGTRRHAEALCRGELSVEPADFEARALERGLAEVSIYHWLAQALEKLCPEAQENVLPELYGHYLEALHAAGDGQEPAGRAQAALETMGPAKLVAKQLSRTHLTVREKAWTTARVGREFFLSTFWPASLILINTDPTGLGVLIAMAYSAAMLYVWWALRDAKSFGNALSRRMKLEALGFVGLTVAAVIFAQSFHFKPSSLVFLCFAVTVIVAGILADLSKIRRLRAKIVRLEKADALREAEASGTPEIPPGGPFHA